MALASLGFNRGTFAHCGDLPTLRFLDLSWMGCGQKRQCIAGEELQNPQGFAFGARYKVFKQNHCTQTVCWHAGLTKASASNYHGDGKSSMQMPIVLHFQTVFFHQVETQTPQRQV